MEYARHRDYFRWRPGPIFLNYRGWTQLSVCTWLCGRVVVVAGGEGGRRKWFMGYNVLTHENQLEVKGRCANSTEVVINLKLKLKLN